MSVQKFDAKEWQILWLKGEDVPKKDKQAIKANLKIMSDDIELAMKYSRESRLKNRRDAIVRIWFDDLDYLLDVDCTGSEDYQLGIYDIKHERLVGHIVSKKWSIDPLFKDESYEAPETL